MKKSLLIFFSAVLFTSVNLLAQPTLTATGINPVVGNVLTVVSGTTAVSPGSAGANQTWNLSGITGSSGSYTVITSSSTPNGSMFPGATLSNSGSGAYPYYNTTSSAYQFYGTYGSTAQYYSNPEDYLHYPCTYNMTFTDAFVCTYSTSTMMYRNGTTTVTADGWGTLTTPAGTFSNVMRLHTQSTYMDTGSIMSFPITAGMTTDLYAWYLNGNHAALASTATYTMDNSGSISTFSLSSYLTNVVVGVSENISGEQALKLFPNPTSDNINIQIESGANANTVVKVTNMLGDEISVMEINNTTANNNLDVSDLDEGIYFIRVYSEGTLVNTRRFVIAR